MVVMFPSGWGEGFGLFVILVISSGILQLLFAPAAAWGWRVGTPVPGDGSQPIQWNVRHILISMTLIAVVLGLLRIVPWRVGIDSDILHLGLVFGGGLFLALACQVSILGAQTWVRGLTLSVGVSVLVLIVEAVLDRNVYRPAWYEPQLTVIHGWIAFWCILMSLLWRRAGLRFLRRKLANVEA